MKKPKYTAEEVHNLLLKIEKERSTAPNGAFETKEALSSFVLCEGESNLDEAYEEIASEAATLEKRAKVLRSVVNAFKCPVKELPKLINDTNNIIKEIARWRMLLGR